MVKNPSAMQETWIRSLGWEDSLEKGTAAHFSVLAWRIPWIEEPGRLQSMWSQSQTQLKPLTHFCFLSSVMEQGVTSDIYVIITFKDLNLQFC